MRYGSSRSALVIAQPVARVLHDVEFSVGVVWQTVAAGLVMRTRARDRAVVLRHVNVDRPWTKRACDLSIGFVQLRSVLPVVVVGKDSIVRRVVTHGEEQVVRHVGLIAE